MGQPPPPAGGGRASADTADDAIRVEHLDHVTVGVTDLGRARDFYQGLLGLREVPRPASFDFPGMWYQIGPAVLHLVGQAQPDAEAPRHFCLWVRDVRAAARRLEAAGRPVRWSTRHKIPGVDRFFTKDPDGNRIEIQGADGSAGGDQAEQP